MYVYMLGNRGTVIGVHKLERRALIDEKRRLVMRNDHLMCVVDLYCDSLCDEVYLV